MKRLVTVFASLVFAGCLQAQTAKVIQLSPEDAAQAKALYAQKADIEKQIAGLEQKITTKYLAKDKSSSFWVFNNQESSPWPWLNGFEYSDDFKFIVPNKAAPAYNGNSSLCNWFTPASSGTLTN